MSFSDFDVTRRTRKGNFLNQVDQLGSKILRYRGKALAHTWHILQAMAYNLKRLPDYFYKV